MVMSVGAGACGIARKLVQCVSEEGRVWNKVEVRGRRNANVALWFVIRYVGTVGWCIW